MNFVIAHPSEASPLIQAYEMKKVEVHPFALYSGNDHNLIISGSGRVKSAAACAFLMGRLKTRDQGWLNLGIAGHGDMKIGSLFVAGRIRDEVSEESFYPPQLLAPKIQISELLTCSRPCQEYKKGLGFDMEAHGFYQAASLFSTRELVQVVKIVSDNPDRSLEKFTHESTCELIERNMPLLDEVIRQWSAFSEEIRPPESIERRHREITSKYRFSSTSSHALRATLLRANRMKLDLDSLLDKGHAPVRNGKEFLKLLDSRLSESEKLP